MKLKDIYKGDPNYMNGTEACEFLGICPHSLKLYVDRFCIEKYRASKYVYYRRDDIDTIQSFLSWGASDLINRLEAMTGKKVRLI